MVKDGSVMVECLFLLKRRLVIWWATFHVWRCSNVGKDCGNFLSQESITLTLGSTREKEKERRAETTRGILVQVRLLSKPLAYKNARAGRKTPLTERSNYGRLRVSMLNLTGFVRVGRRDHAAKTET